MNVHVMLIKKSSYFLTSWEQQIWTFEDYKIRLNLRLWKKMWWFMVF